MDGYQRRTADKKRKIIDAARVLFGRYGFKKVSVEEIAARADVSKVSIYSYYKSKAGLVRTLVDEAIQGRRAAIEGLIHSELPFPEKLRGLILQKSDASSGYSKELLEQILAHPAWQGQPTGDISVLMQEFFEQGKLEGHIDPALSNKVLMLYVELFRKGTEGVSEALSELDASETRRIISMFFRGMTVSPSAIGND